MSKKNIFDKLIDETKTKTTYRLVIDKALWNNFKSVCALKGVSMISVIEEGIKAFIKKQEKKTTEKS
jgi:hypothetical protein